MDTPADGRQLSMEKDSVFHLLQSDRRRAALRFLFEHKDTDVTMRDLSNAVAAWENDTTIDSLTSAERQRVHIALYQSHLPKLADAGIVEFDPDRGRVALLPKAAVLQPFLASALRDEEADIVTVQDSEPGAGVPIARWMTSLISGNHS